MIIRGAAETLSVWNKCERTLSSVHGIDLSPGAEDLLKKITENWPIGRGMKGKKTRYSPDINFVVLYFYEQ